MTMLTRVFTGLLVTLALGSTARAEIITYMVEYGTAVEDPTVTQFNSSGLPDSRFPQLLFDQALADGATVQVGDVIAWRVTATVTDATDATNFGLATAEFSLSDSMDDMMRIANWTVDPNDPNTLGGGLPKGSDFELYSFGFEGNPDASVGDLLGASVTLTSQNALAQAQGANPATVVVAQGSYVLESFGTHTLSFLPPDPALNRYYSAAGQSISGSVAYDDVFATDTAIINAVPEPGSMLLASTLLVPGLIAVRRRRRRESLEQAV